MELTRFLDTSKRAEWLESWFGQQEQLLEPEQQASWDVWKRYLSDSSLVDEPLLWQAPIPAQLRAFVWCDILYNRKIKSLHTSISIYDIARVSTPQYDWDSLVEESASLPSSIDDNILQNIVRRQDELTTTQVRDLTAIVKAYAILDSDVGYTPALIYLAMPLVTLLPLPYSFEVLIHFMYKANARAMFVQHMPLLRRILHVYSVHASTLYPELYQYLHNSTVIPETYASVWFMSLFSNSCHDGKLPPMDCLYSIWDAVLIGGLHASLSLAIGILGANSDILTTVNAEREGRAISAYLRNQWWMVYMPADGTTKDLGKRILQSAYKHRLIPLNPQSVDINSNLHEPRAVYSGRIHHLHQDNQALLDSIRRLNSDLEAITNDHADLEHSLVEAKYDLAQKTDDGVELEEETKALKEAIESMPAQVEELWQSRISEAETRRQDFIHNQIETKQSVAEMQQEIEQLQQKVADSIQEKEALHRKLNEMRRMLTSGGLTTRGLTLDHPFRASNKTATGQSRRILGNLPPHFTHVNRFHHIQDRAKAVFEVHLLVVLVMVYLQGTIGRMLKVACAEAL
ncbi:hypothetical protein BZG36_04851, partial [Bifiguratus adelaidae]